MKKILFFVLLFMANGVLASGNITILAQMPGVATPFWYCRDGTVCTQHQASLSQCNYFGGSIWYGGTPAQPIVEGTNIGPAPDYAYSLQCIGPAPDLIVSWSGVMHGSATTTCPVGYSLSGSICNLTNAALVAPNSSLTGTQTTGTCNVGFMPSSSGNSCVAAPACNAGEVVSSGVYAFDYVTTFPGVDGCNASCTTHFFGSVIGSGIKNGVAVDYAQGSWQKTGGVCSSGAPSPAPVGATGSGVPGDSCPAGQILERNAYGFVCTVRPSGAASSVPSTNTNSGAPRVSNGSGTSTTTTTATGSTSTFEFTLTSPPFPTDLAKSGEAQLAADSINRQLDILHQDLNTQGMPSDVTTQAQTDLANAQNSRDVFKTDIQAMPSMAEPVTPPSLFQPFQPSSCSPLSYTFGSSMTAGSHTVMFDLCPLVPTIQRIGAWGMYLLTAAMLFQMFTRRPDEA